MTVLSAGLISSILAVLAAARSTLSGSRAKFRGMSPQSPVFAKRASSAGSRSPTCCRTSFSVVHALAIVSDGNMRIVTMTLLSSAVIVYLPLEEHVQINALAICSPAQTAGLHLKRLMDSRGVSARLILEPEWPCDIQLLPTPNKPPSTYLRPRCFLTKTQDTGGSTHPATLRAARSDWSSRGSGKAGR